MADELLKDDFGTKLGKLFVSFVVFLSVFFIIKLIIMILLNLVIKPSNEMTVQSIGSIFLILSVGVAAVYTKILNRTGTKESRNKKRIITIVLGVVCLFISTVVLQVS